MRRGFLLLLGVLPVVLHPVLGHAVMRRFAVWFFLLFAAAAAWHPARAQSFPPSPTTTYSATIGGTLQYFGSMTDGCGAIAAASHDAYGNYKTVDHISGNECYFVQHYSDGSTGIVGSFLTVSTSTACPANSTGTSSCTCNSGYSLGTDGASCVSGDAAQCASQARSDAVLSQYGQRYSFEVIGKGVVPANLCDPVAGMSAGHGCNVPITSDINVSYPNKSGVWVTGVSGSAHDGTVCTTGGPSTDPTPDASAQCAPGQVVMVLNGVATCQKPGKCPGTVNGLDVAVDCTNALSTTSTSTNNVSTPATGASGATGTNTSQSVSTTIDCSSGATCTKTTVTVNSDGSTSTSTQSGSKDAVCSGSTGQPACLGSAAAGYGGGNGNGSDSSFAGNCAQGFAASGDAIQSAIVREQYTRDCQNVSVDATTQANVDALTAQAGNAATTAGDTSYSLSSLMPSAPGGGACPISDLSIPFGPTTLSFGIGTALCPKLATIRAVVVAFGFMLWGLIVLGGRRS